MGYVKNASLIPSASIPCLGSQQGMDMGIFGDIGELAAPHCVSSAASVSAPTLLGYFRAPRTSGHQIFIRAYFPMGNVVIQKQVLAVAALLALLSGCDSKKGEMAAPGAVPAAA